LAAKSTHQPERRMSRRAMVCVPLQVRILGEKGLAVLSRWEYGVVTEVSRGGIRIRLAGASAGYFVDSVGSGQRLELRFLTPDFGENSVRGEVNWTEEAREEHAINLGIQYTDLPDADAKKNLKALNRFSKRKSRTGRVLLSIGVAITLAVLLIMVLRNAGQQERLSSQVEDQQARLDKQDADLKKMDEALTRSHKHFEEQTTELNECQEKAQTSQQDTANRLEQALKELAACYKHLKKNDLLPKPDGGTAEAE